MAQKKIKGIIEIKLESKQFTAEAKKIANTLKSLPSFVKKADAALKTNAKNWQATTRKMNTFASVSSMVQKTNYNNLKANTIQMTQAMGKFSQSGITAGKQIQQVGATAKSAGAPVKRFGDTAVITGQKISSSGKAAVKTSQEYAMMGNAANASGKKMQGLANSSTQAAGAMKTVETSSLKTSAGITASVQSTVALTQGIQGTVAAYRDMHQVQIDVEAKEVSVEQIRIGLEKATIDAAAEERALAEARRTGSLSTEELADRTNKLAIEYEQIANDQKDLRVNTEELELVKQRVADTYLNFATNIATTVVGSYGVLSQAINKDTINTIKNIFQKKAVIATNVGLVGSSSAVAASMGAQATATGTASLAMKGLTKAAMGFIFSPPGIALMAIGGLWLAWETNALGFRDAVHAVIDAFQTLGGWIVDIFQPVLNGVSTILRAIGIDVPMLGDSFRKLSNDMSGNIDEWQNLERETRGTKDDMSLLKLGIEDTDAMLMEFGSTMNEVAVDTQNTGDVTEEFGNTLDNAGDKLESYDRKLTNTIRNQESLSMMEPPQIEPQIQTPTSRLPMPTPEIRSGGIPAALTTSPTIRRTPAAFVKRTGESLESFLGGLKPRSESPTTNFATANVKPMQNNDIFESMKNYLGELVELGRNAERQRWGSLDAVRTGGNSTPANNIGRGRGDIYNMVRVNS